MYFLKNTCVNIEFSLHKIYSLPASPFRFRGKWGSYLPNSYEMLAFYNVQHIILIYDYDLPALSQHKNLLEFVNVQRLQSLMHATIQDLCYHQGRVKDCQTGRLERYSTHGACFEEATPLCGSQESRRVSQTRSCGSSGTMGVQGVI